MVPSLKNNLVFREEFLASENSACLDVMPDSDRKLVARVCRDPDYCNRNACIRKCCAEGEVYAKRCSNLAMSGESKEFHEAFANALNQTKNSSFISTKGSTKLYDVLKNWRACTNRLIIFQRWRKRVEIKVFEMLFCSLIAHRLRRLDWEAVHERHVCRRSKNRRLVAVVTGSCFRQ